MGVTIASELFKISKMEYLDSLSCSDLAFWLINSFTPARFRDSNDVVKYAVESLYKRSNAKLIVAEFIERLWGMHGLKPDDCPDIFHENVISFRDKS